MANKEGAYSTKAADTDFRKKWDKEEYAEKARKKDLDERERMQENEERLKQGHSPFVFLSLTLLMFDLQGKDRGKVDERTSQSQLSS
jgi:hypothetical protein